MPQKAKHSGADLVKQIASSGSVALQRAIEDFKGLRPTHPLNRVIKGTKPPETWLDRIRAKAAFGRRYRLSTLIARFPKRCFSLVFVSSADGTHWT